MWLVPGQRRSGGGGGGWKHYLKTGGWGGRGARLCRGPPALEAAAAGVPSPHNPSPPPAPRLAQPISLLQPLLPNRHQLPCARPPARPQWCPTAWPPGWTLDSLTTHSSSSPSASTSCASPPPRSSCSSSPSPGASRSEPGGGGGALPQLCPSQGAADGGRALAALFAPGVGCTLRARSSAAVGLLFRLCPCLPTRRPAPGAYRMSWSLAGVVGVICAGLLLLVAGETKFDLVRKILRPGGPAALPPWPAPWRSTLES